ncbi:MAG: M90 family metallopeptidase, partial [Hyphococcus sp.]
DAHRHIVASRAPLYRRLPAAHRARLEGLINRFLDEITFHGAGGLQMTDEIRLTIAAQACLLLVNKPNRWFTSLRTVFVYPATFKAKLRQADGHILRERDQARAGESWQRGPVVLAWDQTLRGAVLDRDGFNVVLHEFAHQLDEQTGVSDGAPLLDRDQSAAQWAQVLRGAFERLKTDLESGHPNIIDAYGATSPAEFFAVATEVFFERPRDLRLQEPALYRELTHYYRLDPAAWA